MATKRFLILTITSPYWISLMILILIGNWADELANWGDHRINSFFDGLDRIDKE